MEQKGTETTQQISASDRRETSLIGDLLSSDRARSAQQPPASPPSGLINSTHVLPRSHPGRAKPPPAGWVSWADGCHVAQFPLLSPSPHTLSLEFLILGDACESNNSLLRGRPSEAGRSQHGPSLIGLTKAHPCPTGPTGTARADLCATLSWKLSFWAKEGGGNLK